MEVPLHYGCLQTDLQQRQVPARPPADCNLPIRAPATGCCCKLAQCCWYGQVKKWGLCVPVAICCILLLVGGITLLSGHDHVRAANVVSFAGSMLVFLIFVFIVKQTCFEQKSTVKTIFDPAPAYQKRWRKEYYSNIQDDCITDLNQKDESDDQQVFELNQRDNHQEEGFQALHITQTVNKSQSSEPASVKLQLSPLEFLNYGFKETNVDSSNSSNIGNLTEHSSTNINTNSSSHNNAPNVYDTSGLPSYDQAVSNGINTSSYT